MLKLFIIVYVGTYIGATVGPLPIQEEECFKIANKITLEAEYKYPHSHIRVNCEWRWKRPELTLDNIK